MSGSNTLRVIAVIGLLSSALLAVLPVIGCGWNPVTTALDPTALGYCVGFGGPPASPSYGLPGFTGPYWGYLIVGIAFGVAALYVAVSKRL